MNLQMGNDISKPKVSIGMPVYNGEKYIKEAIDSLLSQSYADFELIISDNASTDSTQKICEEYAEQDSRISYVRQAVNIGPAANFAYVRDKSCGEYFMWAAHDDRWDAQFIESTLNIFNKNNDVGLVFSNFIIRNLDTGEERKIHVKSLDYKFKSLNYIVGILNASPSMIYGIYKANLVKGIQLELYDFADLQVISEVIMKSNIKVLKEYLYIAGTKGDRKPYSITHKKIQRIPFLKKQYLLLKRHYCLPTCLFLFLITCMFMIYNKIRLWRY